jgi:hypothetical protein
MKPSGCLFGTHCVLLVVWAASQVVFDDEKSEEDPITLLQGQVGFAHKF